jgi:hypothetical protein
MLLAPATRVPRILGPLARDERMIAIGRECPLFRSRAAAMEKALRPHRVEGGLSPVLVPPRATPSPVVQKVKNGSRMRQFH